MGRVPDPNGTVPSPVVALHGFTQTGACLGPLADALAVDHQVLRPDLPGHGAAGELEGLDLWRTASHLAAAIGPTLEGPAVWIGYSLGARVALHVALAHPEAVAALVLISGTAGIDDEAARHARRRDDEALAARILDVGVDAFLDEWLAGPLFVDLPDRARFDAERRRNTAEGLAGSLRSAGTGTMDPLWDRLGTIGVPVLCITGARDEKFGVLARRMVAALPDAHLEVVADAGHAAHLERPDAVTDVVRRFSARFGRSAPVTRGEPGPRWYGHP